MFNTVSHRRVHKYHYPPENKVANCFPDNNVSQTKHLKFFNI